MTLDFDSILLASISIVGICEWLKNLDINWIKRAIKWISPILCVVFACCYSLHQWSEFSVLAMSGVLLATTQLGYEVLMKPIKDLLAKLVNKEDK